MNITFFELFFILVFSTLYYLCYNLLVAQQVRDKALTSRALTSLQRYQLQEVTTKLQLLLKKEGNDLTDTVRMNTKSLSDLLVDEATEADYLTFVEGIAEVVRDLYKNYQFLRQDPAPEDYTSGYFLVFQFIRGEYPEKYEELFRLAIDKGLDQLKINQLFVEKVAEGDVLALGNAEIDTAQTGVSSILQGQDVRVSITFAPEEYAKRKQEQLDEFVEKRNAEREAQMELAKQKDDALKAIRLAEVVINELIEDIAEKHELEELVSKTKESLGYL